MRKTIVIGISLLFFIGIASQTSARKIKCWDLNQNYDCDLGTEDLNNDNKCNSLDCTPDEPDYQTQIDELRIQLQALQDQIDNIPDGPVGPEGPEGPPGVGTLYVYSAADEFLGMLYTIKEDTLKVLIFIPSLHKFFLIRITTQPYPYGTNDLHINGPYYETDNCTDTPYTHTHEMIQDFVVAYNGYQGENDRNFIVSVDKGPIDFRSHWVSGQCIEIPESQAPEPTARPMTEITLPFAYPIALPLEFEMTER